MSRRFKNTTKIPREDPQRQRNENGDRRGEKNAKCWAPPFGPQPPPSPPRALLPLFLASRPMFFLSHLSLFILSRLLFFFVPIAVFFCPDCCFFCPVCVFLSRRLFADFVLTAVCFFCPVSVFFLSRGFFCPNTAEAFATRHDAKVWNCLPRFRRLHRCCQDWHFLPVDWVWLVPRLLPVGRVGLTAFLTEKCGSTVSYTGLVGLRRPPGKPSTRTSSIFPLLLTHHHGLSFAPRRHCEEEGCRCRRWKRQDAARG